MIGPVRLGQCFLSLPSSDTLHCVINEAAEDPCTPAAVIGVLKLVLPLSELADNLLKADTQLLVADRFGSDAHGTDQVMELPIPRRFRRCKLS
ncbi:hypothetical protein ADL07_22700 [Streptomyces sp. NRRL F-4707]|nr:hypothetical protein ADL07_22700 [Streptomyces sp. NRRL F-4707]